MIKNYKLLIGIMALGLMAFTGCNKDPIRDNTNSPVQTLTSPTTSATFENMAVASKDPDINQNSVSSQSPKSSETTDKSGNTLKSFTVNTQVGEERSKVIVKLDEKYKHVIKKIKGKDVTVYYESTEAENLSKTLGINIEEELYEDNSNNIFIYTPVKASISSNNNDDIIVNAYYPRIEDGQVSLAHNYKVREMFMLFTKEQGKYVKGSVNQLHPAHQKDSSFGFVDIDSDGKNEIYYNASTSSAGFFIQDFVILKYLNGKVIKIFDETLIKSDKSNPFSFNNNITFVQSDSNKNLYDILFKVNIKFNKDIYENSKSWAVPLKIPVEKQMDRNETYTFKFDGLKYVPTKPLIDYRN